MTPSIAGAKMALAVEVQMATEEPGVPAEAQLAGWARAAWRDPGTDADVVVRVCDENESRRLNHDYRGKDRPTNVLSFPYEAMPELGLNHVGDLVICAPVVAREAVEQGKDGAAHWAHMVVHGMLHLQGYDHEDERRAPEMEGLETEILRGLGFPAPYENEEMS
jgi:probable rRNA maturation factor